MPTDRDLRETAIYEAHERNANFAVKTILILSSGAFLSAMLYGGEIMMSLLEQKEIQINLNLLLFKFKKGLLFLFLALVSSIFTSLTTYFSNRMHLELGEIEFHDLENFWGNLYKKHGRTLQNFFVLASIISGLLAVMFLFLGIISVAGIFSAISIKEP